MSAHLVLQDIAICYATKTIVENISFSLEEGEIGCFLGPSGCGKTTLLRTIAGFERPAHGTITLRGNQVASPSLLVPPEKRRVGMVFQDYALFPHLTIEQNIRFGLNKQSKSEQQQRVDELLTLIDLPHTKKRYPHQLSGGQQQRIALARALAPEPDVLLLDEPFSNLDVALREHLAHDVRQLIKAEKVTAILVTHDQQEAFATSDKIALLNNGKLIQWGSASELYEQPNSVFSAEFIGQGSLIKGTVKKDNNGVSRLHTDVGSMEISERIALTINSNSAKLLIRPDKIALSNSESGICVTLVSKSFRGGHYLCSLETNNKQRLTALLPAQNIPNPGTQLFITVSLPNTTPVIS